MDRESDSKSQIKNKTHNSLKIGNQEESSIFIRESCAGLNIE